MRYIDKNGASTYWLEFQLMKGIFRNVLKRHKFNC